MPVKGDTLDERNERFSIVLSDPANATISDGQEVLYGQGGNDVLVGNEGWDMLVGGTGKDLTER